MDKRVVHQCVLIIICLFSFGMPTLATTPQLTITAQPIWRELGNNYHASEHQVFLCYKISIKRRGKPIPLKRLSLQWHPSSPNAPTPRALIPLLYEPKHKEPFKAVESALRSHGVWHAPTRSMHFPLNYKLVGKSTFYLVVQARPEDCERLHNGRLQYTDSFRLLSQG